LGLFGGLIFADNNQLRGLFHVLFDINNNVESKQEVSRLDGEFFVPEGGDIIGLIDVHEEILKVFEKFGEL
jgi:hypothetical protein